MKYLMKIYYLKSLFFVRLFVCFLLIDFSKYIQAINHIINFNPISNLITNNNEQQSYNKYNNDKEDRLNKNCPQLFVDYSLKFIDNEV